ncbi:hypothetical protein [Membranihabitans maritimus]|uniref:hypothetical protein n=1 Tax=Membranihabitans maritimus TaxID=2904244 RepID=UPI001F1C503F|nr:hypothetical protein [Membranihabitans maritimus]
MKSTFVSTEDKIRQKGIKEGMEQSRIQAIQNMFLKGFEVSVICDILEVSPELVEKIRRGQQE